MKNKIKPNDICVYDIHNALKLSVNAPVHVIALERIKYKPFGKSVWRCSNLEEDSNINYLYLTERLLQPVAVAIVRNPANMPIINENDIALIKSLIKQEETVLQKCIESELDTTIVKNNVSGLKKLLNKFDTLYKMQNV